MQLINPDSAPADYDPSADFRISTWETLLHLIAHLERDGIDAAADLVRATVSNAEADFDADLLKELAHLLFRVAEANGWTKDALGFNLFVTSWPEIADASRRLNTSAQQSLDYQ